MDDVMTLQEASVVLHCHPEVLRRWARAGRIPGSKIGKRWLFIRSDLIDYVRSHQHEVSSCPSIAADVSGGSDLLPRTDAVYLDLLRQKTG